jgi:hypothetical protein
MSSAVVVGVRAEVHMMVLVEIGRGVGGAGYGNLKGCF